MGVPNVSATWVITLPYISAISQIFYLKMFKLLDKKGHRMERTMKRLTDVHYEDIKFGPLKRGRKRMMALDKHGFIPNSILLKDLSIDPEKWI